MSKKCKFCGKEFKRNGVKFHEIFCEKNSLSKPMEKKPMEPIENQDVVSYGKPMEENSLSKPMDSLSDPEYDLQLIREGVWQCSNCKVLLDEIENRCPNCNARFQ